MSIHPILQGLNPPQREAVTQTEGPLLVLAGAGSGKTRVLTRRIAWLLEKGLARRHQLLAVTFTNKAAREMAHRIESLCGPGRFPFLGTFHSVCCRWLRLFGERLGIPAGFTIYDSSEQLVVMKAVLKQMNLDEKRFPPRSMLSRVSHAKNHLVDAERLVHSKNPLERDVGQAFALYQERLKASGALDFDDLLVRTVQLFREHSDVLEQFQEQLAYILIDEYQDVNQVQYELVRMLASRRRNLCVVGDDDQSIYGFRGADLSILLRFEQDYPEARVVKLEQNYRSTQSILDLANALVRHNTGRKGKNLWCDQGKGALPRVFSAADGRDEAHFVVGMMKRLNEQGRSFQDMVVLYRTNAQSRLLEETLNSKGVPYDIVGGLRFYERKEIKDVLAYLRLLANPADSISLRRILDCTEGVGDTSVQRLESFARARGVPVFAALDLASEAGVRGKAAERMQALKAWMGPLMQRLGSERVGVTELVVEVLTQSGYRSALQTEAQDKVESQARLENLEELLNVTGEFDPGAGDEESPLQAFLGQVSLLSDQDTYQEAVDRVTLMTVHTAKGLEFPVVFLAGLEEETFPHLRALEEGDSGMEEERRLCYVGITRAREQLFLSWARSREMRGLRLPRRISRFLKEVPEELLDAPDLALGSGRYLDDEGPAIGSGRWRGATGTSGSGRPAFSRPVAAPVPRVQTARGEAARSRVAEIGAVRAGPRAEREAEVAGRFPVGTPVTHKVFGQGTVQGVERDLVTVLFEGGKQRTLKQDFLQTSTPSVQARAKECGDRVRHPRWGNGVVKAVDSQNVTVIFPGITVTMSHEEARRG